MNVTEDTYSGIRSIIQVILVSMFILKLSMYYNQNDIFLNLNNSLYIYIEILKNLIILL